MFFLLVDEAAWLGAREVMFDQQSLNLVSYVQSILEGENYNNTCTMGFLRFYGFKAGLIELYKKTRTAKWLSPFLLLVLTLPLCLEWHLNRFKSGPVHWLVDFNYHMK